MEVDCDKPCVLKDIFSDEDKLSKYCSDIARVKNNKMLERLRPMELRLLPYFGKGEINKEIAKKFFVEETTIKTHKRNIIKNLGLKNTAELICFIVRCGII